MESFLKFANPLIKTAEADKKLKSSTFLYYKVHYLVSFFILSTQPLIPEALISSDSFLPYFPSGIPVCF